MLRIFCWVWDCVDDHVGAIPRRPRSGLSVASRQASECADEAGVAASHQLDELVREIHERDASAKTISSILPISVFGCTSPCLTHSAPAAQNLFRSVLSAGPTKQLCSKFWLLNR